MEDIHQAPFNYLPLNQGDDFDLTCEFLIAKLKKAYKVYNRIMILAEEISLSGNFDRADELFSETYDFVSGYAQLIRTVNLALNYNKPVFQFFSFTPNTALHESIRSARNTTEHFEERLRDYGTAVEPFLRISCTGMFNWEIAFGNGGYQGSGYGSVKNNIYDAGQLIYQSYKVIKGKIHPVSIRISDCLSDINAMAHLVKDNLHQQITKKGISCPPPRDLSVILSTDD